MIFGRAASSMAFHLTIAVGYAIIISDIKRKCGDTMELDKIIEAVRVPLKNNGYKKKDMNWYKINDTLSVVFNIQRSQYDADLWYYNFGIGINDLEVKPITTITKCHITDRIDKAINGKEIPPDIILKAIYCWESKYGDLGKLRVMAIENKLPKASTRQAISYLTSV